MEQLRDSLSRFPARFSSDPVTRAALCSSRKAEEELCVVIDGSWQLKLDDTLLDGGPSDVFRVARVARGF